MAIPNQAPNSSVAGFLQPIPGTAPPVVELPLEGQTLEDYIQQYIAGVAGMEETLVRPRWQPEPPNIPDYGVDWCAVGITHYRPIGPYPAVIYRSQGNGRADLQRHEELDVLASFYGPNADIYAGNLHSGLGIWQNYAVLRLVGMAFIEIDEGIHAPELIRERWWNRVDKNICFRRIIRRYYPVLTVLSADGMIYPDPSNYRAPITVRPPPLTPEPPTEIPIWDEGGTWDDGTSTWDTIP